MSPTQAPPTPGTIMQGAYTWTLHRTGAAVDDPDIVFYEEYNCASTRNDTKYCNRELGARIDEPYSTVDPVKRKKAVQAIELRLQQYIAWPGKAPSARGPSRGWYCRSTNRNSRL